MTVCSVDFPPELANINDLPIEGETEITDKIDVTKYFPCFWARKNYLFSIFHLRTSLCNN